MKTSYKERHCQLSIREKMAGRRIDSYLAARFATYSRCFFQKLIEAGKVTVDDKRVKNSTTLYAGCKIVLTLPAVDKRIIAEEIDLDIIYADDVMLCINKRPFVVVHPARGNISGTVINAMFGKFRHEIETIDGFYPKVVHRLDKNTSGLLMLGLREREHAILSSQFEYRRVRKLYQAICHGVVKDDEGEVDLPIGFSGKDDERMAIRHDEGRNSLTFYKVLRRFRDYTLVELELKTGRTHQIRVHMATLGHPLVGDEPYGGVPAIYPQDILSEAGESLEPVIERQALHSSSITCHHPVTRQLMTVTAPLTSDMADFIALLERAGR